MKTWLSGALCLLGLVYLAGSDVLMESRAPSMELSSGAYKTGEAFVAVKNSSDRSVLLVSWSESIRALSQHSVLPLNWSDSVRASQWHGPIKPNETLVLSPRHPGDNFLVGQSVSAVLVRAALFDDGTYEGDMTEARRTSLHYIGNLIQFERARKLIDEIMAGPGTDEEKVNSIHDALSALSDRPDRTMFERWEQDFPLLNARYTNVFGLVGLSMTELRTDLLNSFDSFKRNINSDRMKKETLVMFWEGTRKTYEDGYLLDYRQDEK